MQQSTRTEQRGEIVQSGRAAVSGPATRWMPGDNIDFPIERLGGGDVGTVGGALAPLDPAILGAVGGSEEYATPTSRAKGQVLRLLPFTAVWLILTGGLVWLLGLAFPFFLVGFALLTAATYLRMNLDEFRYSRNGLERHRVNVAADVRFDEAEKTHELRMKALSGYLKHLGVNDDD